MFRLFRRKKNKDGMRDSASFDETMIVWDIALMEALPVGHVPGMIHLLGASLYRLRDADPVLANELEISVEDIRKWEMLNLPSSMDSIHRPYAGNLHFEYTVQFRNNRMCAGRVRRPVKRDHTQYPEHYHPPGQGIGVLKFDDSRGISHHQTPLRSLFQFLEVIRTDTLPSESSATTLRRIIAGVLSAEDVQTCLKDLGVAVDRLETKLGESTN